MDKKNVALVTGASKGIGRAIAKTLAEDRYLVVANYLSSKEDAEKLKEEILRAGGRCEIYKADVSSASQAKELIEFSESIGEIEVLVNNAGIVRDSLILRMTEEDWDRVIEINLKGAFNCVKEAARFMMKRRKGVIINISSIVGIYGNIGQVNYASSKAALIGFTKSLAKELGRRNIRVNAIAPGFILTEMTQKLSEEMEKEIKERIPLGRFGTPEEVAYLVSFLCSNKASYINGAVIEISGGLIV